MKRKGMNWLLAAFVVTTFCSCGNSDANSIDYLPCKVEKGQDWGFVNPKGKVFLADEFPDRPSNVQEGVFSVREGAGYSLYAFDRKKPKLLLEDLKDVGEPRGGLLPVCKFNDRIEIVNLKGKTILELSAFDGNEVIGCARCFNEYGWLEVYTIDNDGMEHKILVDKKGQVVFSAKNKYDSKYWKLINKNLIFGFPATEEGEAVDGLKAFNLKNEEQNEWTRIVDKQDKDIESVNGYILTCNTETDGRIYIYNMEGKVVMKCPEKVSAISSIKRKQFVFRSQDYTYGVMNFSGETILSAKYSSIEILDNGYLVNKSNGKYEVLNKKGEKERNLDWNEIAYFEGFGWVAVDGNDYYIVNDKFEAIHKTELSTIANVYFGSGEDLNSDYFDMEAAIGKTMTALRSGLQGSGFYFGNTPDNIPAIKNAWIYSLPGYKRYDKVIAAGNKYTLVVSANFDGVIVKKAELNGKAKIELMSITLDFPMKHKSEMKEKMQKALSDVFETEDGKTYTSKAFSYKLLAYSNKIEIVIQQIEPVSEEDELMNELVELVTAIFDEPDE